jgi:hypothetical protein
MTTQARNNKRRREDDDVSGIIDDPSTPQRLDAGNGHDRFHAFSGGTYIVIHRVECNRINQYHRYHVHTTDYLDVPYLAKDANKMTLLQGRQRLANSEDFLEDHSNLNFAVFMMYECEAYHEEIKDKFERLPMPRMDEPITSQAKPYFYVLRGDATPARPRTEQLVLSERLQRSLRGIFDGTLAVSGPETKEKRETTDLWENPVNLVYPYFELYYQRQLMIDHIAHQTMSVQSDRVQALCNYLEERLGPEFTAAEALFQPRECSRYAREQWSDGLSCLILSSLKPAYSSAGLLVLGIRWEIL